MSIFSDEDIDFIDIWLNKEVALGKSIVRAWENVPRGLRRTEPPDRLGIKDFTKRAEIILTKIKNYRNGKQKPL